MYTYANTGKYKYRRKQADSVVSGMNGFINFLTSVHRHEQTDTILTMLTILSDPHKRAAHLVVFKISVGRDLQNSNYMPQR